MAKDDRDDGDVLPKKERPVRARGSTVYLHESMWAELDDIALASGGYSRNEVIVRFLEKQIAAWRRASSAKRGKP